MSHCSLTFCFHIVKISLQIMFFLLFFIIFPQVMKREFIFFIHLQQPNTVKLIYICYCVIDTHDLEWGLSFTKQSEN